jgi:hypothetical protein
MASDSMLKLGWEATLFFANTDGIFSLRLLKQLGFEVFLEDSSDS